MATDKQIRYAKDLLRKNGLDPEGFTLNSSIPNQKMSDLIGNCLRGTPIPEEDWNESIKRLEAEEVVPDPLGDGPGLLTSEINLIKSLFLRDFVQKLLDKIPEYFYTIPASSTGKYHPEYALGKGGLLRHTKAAVLIAKSLFDDPALHSFSPEERDIVIAALILHDTVKHGFKGSKYSVTEHPLLVEELISSDLTASSTEEEEAMVNTMVSCIRSHMGPWTTNYEGQEVLPRPKTEIEIFTHLCDYLASRKFLEVKF